MNSLIMLLIIVPALAFLLLLLNVVLAVHKPDESKVSAYECGFISIFGQTRSNFQIHFFLVALLFLVFDLEIILIMPVGVTLYDIGNFGFSIFVIFFMILTIGFVLEIGSGAIKFTSDNNNLNTPSNNMLKVLDFPHRLNKSLIYFNFAKIKVGFRYYSTKSNNNFSKNRINSTARWLFGYNPNKFVILSILLKGDVLLIFDHTNLEIKDYCTINQYNRDRKNLIFDIIVKASTPKSIYKFNIIPILFNNCFDNYWNKELVVIVSDFLFDAKLKNYYKNKDIELIPISKYKEIPPVSYYILRHINYLNLEKKMIKKIFKKKEKHLRTLYFNQISHYDY